MEEQCGGVVAGRVYVFGKNTTEVWEEAKNERRTLAMPWPMASGCASALRLKTFFLVGRGGVVAFDSERDEWRRLPDPPRVFLEGNAAIVGNFLHVVDTKDHWVLDILVKSTWMRKAPTQFGHHRSSLTEHEGYLWAVGGQHLHLRRNCATMASIERYDPKSNTWTVLPSMPEGRSHHFAISLDRGLLVVGGGGDTARGCNQDDTADQLDTFSDSLFFDTKAFTWHRVATPNNNMKSQVCALKKEGMMVCYHHKNVMEVPFFISEPKVSWFDGSFHDPRLERNRAFAESLDAAIFAFWRQSYVPAREKIDGRFVNLSPLCDAFDAARMGLSHNTISEVLANASLRRKNNITYVEDRTYNFLLQHWAGVCASRRLSLENLHAAVLSARSAYDAFRSHFDSQKQNYAKVFRLKSQKPADGCVFWRREVNPSFIHGVLWDKYITATSENLQILGQTFPETTCAPMGLYEGPMKGDCLHALGHGIALRILDDLQRKDDVLSEAEKIIRAPIMGAYYSLQRHKLLGDMLKNASALACRTILRGDLKRVPGCSQEDVDRGIRHSLALYTLFNPKNPDAHIGFVPYPSTTAPVTKPCDFNQFADADSNFRWHS